MALTRDIVAMWRRPGTVWDRLIAAGRREDLALTHALVGGVVHFIAASPAAARTSYIDPAVPVEARLFWQALLFVFVLPLIVWLCTMLVGGIAGLLGRRQLGYQLRLTLFWSLLAAAPMALLLGLVAGLIGPGGQMQLVAGLWIVAFGGFTIMGLIRPNWAKVT
jgi:Na+/H+-dicarboxylate symporter